MNGYFDTENLGKIVVNLGTGDLRTEYERITKNCWRFAKSMARTENVELTVLCLLHRDGAYLLQDRKKKDWKGYTLPGGHVEPGESFVNAVIREMKEETGLTILNPKLCGIKQFPIEGGRYLVFLFEATEYEGELISSEEGAMHWVRAENLKNVNLVNDFEELVQVMLNESLNEFQYVIADGKWEVLLK